MTSSLAEKVRITKDKVYNLRDVIDEEINLSKELKTLFQVLVECTEDLASYIETPCGEDILQKQSSLLQTSERLNKELLKGLETTVLEVENELNMIED